MTINWGAMAFVCFFLALSVCFRRINPYTAWLFLCCAGSSLLVALFPGFFSSWIPQ